MGKYVLDTVAVGPLQANCHILGCGVKRCAAVIDPGGDAGLIAGRLDALGLVPVCIIDTHAHPDHTAANAELVKKYRVPLMIHEADAPLLAQAGLMRALIGFFFPASPEPDRLLRDGDTIPIGRLTLRVIHTPGHSPGGICLFCVPGEKEAPILMSGDTIFEGSVGRTDLPGGSHEELIESLRRKIMTLPANTMIFCGHGPATTLAHERAHNPFLQG
ncbi:MAG: MBL fold metallo-hydrolase [Candidatus Aureabacteria bacterium]|nr:MBL fold metallo-hydrolase [Candidatus Auribacterota bacterium]